MMLKKGTLVIVSDGEYSDYRIEGMYELTQDVEVAEDPQKLSTWYDYIFPLEFQEAAKRLSYVEIHRDTLYYGPGHVRLPEPVERCECQQKE